MTLAVIYAARSKDEEPGKDSTDNQIRDIRVAIEREGGREVIGEYADHASGFSGDRGPGLASAMRAAIDAGAELWVFKSERLARGSGRRDEARSVMEVYVDLRRAGVDIRSAADDEYFTNPMLVGVADAMAHKYSTDLSAHVRRGLEANARKGIPHGTPPLGYARGNGHWYIDRDEAEVVRRIYRMYVEDGLSYSGIARRLNAEGLPTRNHSKWSPTVIRKLLTCRHALGMFRFRAEWHQGQHPPIIDQAVWDAAQVRADAGRKYAPNGRVGRMPRSHIFVRGALKCGMCGATMRPRSNRYGEWYECATHFETGGSDACPMPPMRRAPIERAALSLFENVALDVEATRDRLAAQMARSVDETTAQRDRAERDVSAKRAALARFDRDYESGDLSAANYERQVARVSEELAAAEAEHERITRHISEISNSIFPDPDSEVMGRLVELRAAVAARIGTASADVNALRAAWASVFAHTTVMPDADEGFDVMPVLRHDMVEGGWDDRDGYATGAPSRRVPVPFESNKSTATQVALELLTGLFGSAQITMMEPERT